MQTVLLADADVLIDYRESDLGVLALVAKRVARTGDLFEHWRQNGHP